MLKELATSTNVTDSTPSVSRLEATPKIEFVVYATNNFSMNPNMVDTLCWDSVLSSEITMHIFTFLDHSALNVASNVCKTWKDLSKEKSLWRSIATEQIHAMSLLPQENFTRIDTRLRGPNCQIFPSQKKDKPTEDVKFVQSKIKRGTIDKIMELFTSPFSAKKYTENDLDVFLTCYQDFVTSEQLFCMVLQKCFINNLIDDTTETFEGPFYVLYKWIQLGPEDFSPDMRKLLICVIKYVESAVDITKCQTVLAVKNYLSTAQKRNLYFSSPLIPLKSTENIPSIMSFDAKEVAEYLTFLEHNLYTHIKFFHRAWKTPQKHQVAPHVTEVIRRFSKLSSWLASAILACKLPAERAKVIVHLVDILINLRKLNNFNAASAIVGGLSSAPVFRLKKTWECVPKKYVSLLEQEESDLMESRANYQAYHQKMRSISEICFPYLGILLSDLTFIDDGNAAMRNGQIMFNRLHLIKDSIDEFFVHIRKPFPLQDFKPSAKLEELVGYIYGSTKFNDNDLYHLSLEREPKIVS